MLFACDIPVVWSGLLTAESECSDMGQNSDQGSIEEWSIGEGDLAEAARAHN
jgi:hypothetical protein